MGYNWLFKKDTCLLEYHVQEDRTCPFQLLTITGTTASGRELSISKLDINLVACLDNIAVFADNDAPEQMTAEEILAHIGFTVRQEASV